MFTSPRDEASTTSNAVESERQEKRIPHLNHKSAFEIMTTIRSIPTITPSQRDELSTLLVDSVEGGASLGFLAPLEREEAAGYWRSVDEALSWGLELLVAEDNGRIVGSVQLAPCTKANGRHRAEIQKLFVLTAHQGKGIGSALMAAAEERARRTGRTLLVLDTHTGSKAENLYVRSGWKSVGTIPDYAASPDGELHATTIFYKRID